MSKYYTTARLLYRLHKITEDEALAICGPRAKDETAGS